MVLSKHDVFICFRGEDVRKNLLIYLENELKRTNVKYYVDHKETRGEVIDILLQRIEESRLVLIIFSENFFNSAWCIKELLKVTEMVPKVKVIPIFYKVTVEDVKHNWKIGENVKRKYHNNSEEMEKQVKEALRIITKYMGIRSSDFSAELDFINKIVEEVQKVLKTINESENKHKDSNKIEARPRVKRQEMSKTTSKTPQMATTTLVGITKRLQKLQEKLQMFEKTNETRVIGVLGMSGIGKSTLVKMLFDEKKDEFQRKMLFVNVHKTWKENGPKCLRVLLLQNLLVNNKTIVEETTHENVENELLETKVFLVLDNLRHKKQLELLLGDRKWIKKGSKIVVVASDKSVVDGLVDDTYVVPELNEPEGLDCFRHHAFGDSIPEGNWINLSKEFANFAKGNPFVLKELGLELRGHDETYWRSKLRELEQSPSRNIQDVLKVSYDGLNEQEKEAFLDVTCYFRSENYKFVESLVSNDGSEIKALADKFLIEISSGRIEMNSLLYTLGKRLASKQVKRLWNHQDIINVLEKKPQGDICVEGIRGMFLDMSAVAKKIPLDAAAFDRMTNLRYLKFHDSVCYQESEAECKLIFPDGINFGLQEIRYLHWLKFPLEEFPPDFDPKNLIDLKLPYSKIKRLWDNVKETRNLKWVDLNHSNNLSDLTGLVGAQNLQRLNLESCTDLKTLPKEMENMVSLIVLNLRGCTSLVSLEEMNIKSLKTLILTGCSNLEDFQVISQSLEALYLDGTSLKGLPDTINKLEKLVLLRMNNCKSLQTVPNCLGNMKSLQEVILSGCVKLKSFPHLQKNMRRLRILLLDGTSIKEVPNLLQYSEISIRRPTPLLRHLCLRGNNVIISLPPHMDQLQHLLSIDLKYCKKLTSVPTLPPNLQCFDATGCESLETIGNPLAVTVLSDQVNSTFTFSNCHQLDEVAKSSIVSYIEKKGRLMSHSLNRYNLDSVSESFIGICFPGSEVPAWFSHQSYGEKIVFPELHRYWRNDKITGLALCAVVSFTNHQNHQNQRFLKCTYEFKNANGCLKRFNCPVGTIQPRKIESDHVFIGYISWLQIKKQEEEVDSEDQAYLRFEVIDGRGDEVKVSQVVKCGFRLVYEVDETEDDVSWEITDPNMNDVTTTPVDLEEFAGQKTENDVSAENLLVLLMKTLWVVLMISIFARAAFVLAENTKTQ